MTKETIDILAVVLPALSAGVGAVVATKVSVAQLRRDVTRLFEQVEDLRSEFHNASLDHEREHGEVKAKLAALSVQVENIHPRT